jgi:hypothetical protein
MSTITGFVPDVVDGPGYRSSANALVTAATVHDDASLRWAGGAKFLSNAAIGVAGQLVIDGCAPWDKGETSDHDWEVGLPIVLYTWWQCSPAGQSFAEAQARAHAMMLNSESAGLENILWPWLKRGGLTPMGTPQEALGAAEQSIGAKYAGEGVLHMDRFSATQLAFYLNRSGTSLRTYAANTPVVVGDGYIDVPVGGDPVIAGTTVVGTGPIAITRGPVIDLTPEASAGFGMATNDMTAVVERAYLVLVDNPQGAAYSAPVTP